MEKKALRCSRLFDPVAGLVKRDVVVLLIGNKIEAVVPAKEAGNLEDYEQIDLTARFVSPGLIDVHVHLGISGQPNPGATRPRETDADWTLTGLKNAQTDLMAGFTSLRVCGDRNFISEAIRNSINRGEFYGPRLMTSGMYIGTTGSHADDSYSPYLSDPGLAPFVVDGTAAMLHAVRYNVKHGCDFIKFMSTGGVMSPGTTVGVQQMSFEEMKTICDAARMYGMTTATHANGTSGIKDAIRAGVTSIEHGTIMDDEAVALMVEYKTTLVPTLLAPMHIIEHGSASGIPQWAIDKSVSVHESHIRGFKACMEAGVEIVFGTDTGTPFSLHGGMAQEFALLVAYGMAPERALYAATLGAAKLMRWEDKVGSVEPGKLADLVAFEGDPLADPADYLRCSFVMKDGIVYKNV